MFNTRTQLSINKEKEANKIWKGNKKWSNWLNPPNKKQSTQKEGGDKKSGPDGWTLVYTLSFTLLGYVSNGKERKSERNKNRKLQTFQ